MPNNNTKTNDVRKATVHLQGGQASPTQFLSRLFGSMGCSQQLRNFCNDFNEKTKEKGNEVISVVIYFKNDKTISFEIKGPVITKTLMLSLGIQKGSSIPNQKKVATININTLRELAKRKIKYLNARNLDSAVKILTGSVKSMGVNINFDDDDQKSKN